MLAIECAIMQTEAGRTCRPQFRLWALGISGKIKLNPRCLGLGGRGMLSIAQNAGRPCKSTSTLPSTERQCVIRSKDWLDSVKRPAKPLFQMFSESNAEPVEKLRRL